MKCREIFKELLTRLKEPRKFIQVLLGPRQVGKTTLALQLQDHLKIPCYYITADTATLEDLVWLHTQWETARQKMHSFEEGLLIIDEVQKIPSWSDVIKKLWDEDSRKGVNLKVIILGASCKIQAKNCS